VEVNDHTLAFDMIREVGPRGSFLGQRRTADDLPKLWRPSILLERSKEMGRKYRDPVEVAREMIAWIRENHHPEPLDAATRQELQRIVARADGDPRLTQAIRRA
jgi:trimethylamine:corrinoid methyltransferase-like protein